MNESAMNESIEKASQGEIAQRRQGSYGYVVSFEDEEGAGLSPIQLASTLLRHRSLISMLVVASGVLSLILSLVLRRYYAESSFAPLGTHADASQLAGLAAQFGVSLGGLTGGESVDFYASLLESRALLGAAVLTQYRLATDKEGHDSAVGNLIDLYSISADTPEERVQKAIKKLDHNVDVKKDVDAGIVTLEVKAKWPALAEQINRRLLWLVNDFNLHKRQSHAAAERHFVEDRLLTIRSELDSAEQEQARFFATNRTYQDSPRLRVEAARLQRRVDLIQQVYLTLSQSYEQSRIDEVRNTPVITVVDEPEGSARHTGSLLLNVILGLVLGAVLGIGWAFGREYLSREEVVHASTHDEFARLLRGAMDDLRRLPRRPLIFLRGLVSRSR